MDADGSIYPPRKNQRQRGSSDGCRISLWHIPQGANRVGFQYGATGLYSLAGAPYDAVHVVAGYLGGLLGDWDTASGYSEPATIDTKQTSVDITYELTIRSP